MIKKLEGKLHIEGDSICKEEGNSCIFGELGGIVINLRFEDGLD